MLGILILIFIGRSFYKLSETYDKNNWLYAILGIVSYYGGMFAAGFFLAILDEIFSLNIDFDNNSGLGLMGLPFGILASFLFYIVLKNNWETTSKKERSIEAFMTKYKNEEEE